MSSVPVYTPNQKRMTASIEALLTRVTTLELDLAKAYRSLEKAGELVEALGNGTSTCRSDTPPFKSLDGETLEALGVSISAMARDRTTHFEELHFMNATTARALSYVCANGHLVKSNVHQWDNHSDAASMLALAEKIFIEAENRRGTST
jgi:hypothetical protein